MEDPVFHVDKDTKQYIIVTQASSYYISQSDVTNNLGSGAFGTVYKATNNKSEFAIKQIPKSKVDRANVLNEIQIMSTLSKSGAYCNLVTLQDWAESSQFFFIVMPLYKEGTLTHKLNSIISEFEAMEYFRQICYGLLCLKKFNIIHRDLKTDNLLLSNYSDPSYPCKYLISITDYGLGKANIENYEANTINVGTCLTRAPELSSGVYDYKADIYSLGCIFYKMLSRMEPFSGQSEAEVASLKNRKQMKLCLDALKCQSISKLSLHILSGCLQYDKENRMSIEELDSLLNISTLYTTYSPIKLATYSRVRSNETVINLSLFNRKECLVLPIYPLMIALTLQYKTLRSNSSQLQIKYPINQTKSNILTNCYNCFEFMSSKLNSYQQNIKTLIQTVHNLLSNHHKLKELQITINMLKQMIDSIIRYSPKQNTYQNIIKYGGYILSALLIMYIIIEKNLIQK